MHRGVREKRREKSSPCRIGWLAQRISEERKRFPNNPSSVVVLGAISSSLVNLTTGGRANCAGCRAEGSAEEMPATGHIPSSWLLAGRPEQRLASAVLGRNSQRVSCWRFDLQFVQKTKIKNRVRSLPNAAEVGPLQPPQHARHGANTV